MRSMVKRFWSDQQGLELSEYAVMAGLIIVIAVAVILLVGTHINSIFNKLEGAMGSADGSTT